MIILVGRIFTSHEILIQYKLQKRCNLLSGLDTTDFSYQIIRLTPHKTLTFSVYCPMTGSGFICIKSFFKKSAPLASNNFHLPQRIWIRWRPCVLTIFIYYDLPVFQNFRSVYKVEFLIITINKTNQMIKRVFFKTIYGLIRWFFHIGCKIFILKRNSKIQDRIKKNKTHLTSLTCLSNVFINAVIYLIYK